MKDSLNRWITTGVLILFAISGLIYSRYGYTTLYPGQIEFVNSEGKITGGDFLVFHNAAVMTLEGMAASVWDHAVFDARLFETYGQKITKLHFFYPPVALLLWAPLGLMSHAFALWVWTVVPLSILAFAIFRLTRDWIATALTAIAPITAYTAGAGQTGIFLTAVFAVFVFYRRTRPATAGATASMFAIKPHLAIVLPLCLLLDRNWRALAAMVLAGIVLCVAATLLFGWQVWFAFLDGLRFHSSDLNRADNLTFDRSLSILILALKLGLSRQTAWAAQLLVTSASLAAFAVVWTRSSDELHRVFALALSVCLLTPKILHYDAMVLLVPIAMLVARARKQGGAETSLLLLAFLVWYLPYFEPAFRMWGFNPGGVLLFAGLAWIAFKTLAQRRAISVRR